MRVLLGLPLLFVDSNEFLATASVLAKTIIRDSIKPGREARFAAKAPDVFVGPDKRVLGQIIRQPEVAPRELPQQTADARLMPTNQLAIRMLVVIDKSSCNKCGIG